MKKKFIILLFLSLIFSFEVFSQQKEKITFTELRVDGTFMGTVTVNAILFGWSQQKMSIENGFWVTHESFYPAEWSPLEKRWSDWELVNREPSPVRTIRQLYDTMLSQYVKYPRASMRLKASDGSQVIRLMAIPNRHSSPLWWSEDGKSVYIFYEVYKIVS